MFTKIGSGYLKGKSIKTPNSKLTRVTTSYSRKVIFDTLAPYIDDNVVIDLFAGSGSLGIEAISRGAKKVYFFDSGAKAVSIIKENVATLDLKDFCKVIKSKAEIAIKNWKYESCDLLFLDPPYSIDINELMHLISMCMDSGVLKDSSIICLESPSKAVGEILDSLDLRCKVLKNKKKGNTTLLFIQCHYC